MIITQLMADADIRLKDNVGDMLARAEPPWIVDACVSFSAALLPSMIDNFDSEVADVVNQVTINDLIANHRDIGALYETVKDIALITMDARAKQEIDGGFISSALGAPHTYPSGDSDQLNLIGAVTAGALVNFKCDNGSGYTYKPHNAAQIRQVLQDGTAIKSAILEKASDKNVAIEAILNSADVKSKKLSNLSLISW